MKLFILHCMNFLHRKDGASGIEYAVIATMVAVVLAGFVPEIASAVKGTFTTIKDAL
ncbi:MULTISPECIES: Flp family type IVb pilin [Pseudomonas]|uniref:Flp family type IVb pilin n=1 Tax=Pseudomonas juntendi TaxID=2666183 RepID=A0A7W2R066_9PSED|nr:MULTISPECIES: Flp family type IVb pilin [Pseudomonas]QOH71460.1 Flp family type IVb pilin [Pseudomonas putida]MBA6133995.1 Flp family type IVb pilin [Pseudomonas juntendi]MBA6149396.1 Flp family type IVb pilin [Pseudomonas juntendi]MCK2110100.1 Flp family type IVb pilin [Pseudomonas juntendi]MCK2117114.1 Flp family type IVb pilin [Pseudomonas juntendi]